MKKVLLSILVSFPLLSFTPPSSTTCHDATCLTQPVVVEVLKIAKTSFGTNLGTLVSEYNHGAVVIEHWEKGIFRVGRGGLSTDVIMENL